MVGCPVVTDGAIVLTAPPEAAEIEREKVKSIHLAFLGPVYMKKAHLVARAEISASEPARPLVYMQ